MKPVLFLCFVILFFATRICADEPAGKSSGRRPAEKTTGQQNELLAKVRKQLQPWHPFQEAWASDATLIFKATYEQHRLPCVAIAPGVLAMPLGSFFTVTSVVNGEVKFKEAIWPSSSREGEAFPEAFMDGRSYLVFLKPGEHTRQEMQKPDAKTLWVADAGEEVVAIIDLSQGKAEAEAVRVQATQSGTYQDFQFTPEKWAALRKAQKIELASERQFIPFLQNVVLADGATLGQVRSFLGKPDYQNISKEGISYHYKFNSGTEPQNGDISGSLKVDFTPGLLLTSYQIDFARCEIRKDAKDAITSIAWMTLSEEESKRLGLPRIRKTAKAGR